MLPDTGAPQTLFDKIWYAHSILEREDGATLLYIDRHLVHDGSSQAFDQIEADRLGVRRPDLTLALADHYVPGGAVSQRLGSGLAVAERLQANAARWGIRFHGRGDDDQGIVHVAGPELGFTLPGATVVCGDSHTSTHGALGALAFGIGSSEVAHVLATQTLWQRKPGNLRVRFTGRLSPGVTAKDLALALIGKTGAGGANGYMIEFCGEAVEALGVEARMTLCNMSIELGGRAGFIAPDDTTFQWLAGRPLCPAGAAWDDALAAWRTLRSDEGARFDAEIAIDTGTVAPMVTWGTSPEDVLPIDGRVPDPAECGDPRRRERMASALAYMGLEPGRPLDGLAIDRVFIGSCTNSRIEDLRAAAAIVRGARVKVPTLVVPGSARVRAQAEAEGLAAVFTTAGMEWGEPGCSMCTGMNGDTVPPGERCASTTNRNFVGRQGRDSRTHLVSPAMAAAAAVKGRLTDIRRLEGAVR